MSLEIYSKPQVVPPSQTPPLPPAAHVPAEPEKHAPEEAHKRAETPDLFRGFDRIFAPHHEKGHRGEKTFMKLAGSLQKAFDDAPRVDHDEGEEGHVDTEAHLVDKGRE